MTSKQELLNLIDPNNILCASIEYSRSAFLYKNDGKKFSLKQNHTKEELDGFLNSIDFKFGSYYLRGFVWLNDGSWLAKVNYDGTEWWEHRVCPKIPAELLGVDVLKETL
jgi:hypothetical protein